MESIFLTVYFKFWETPPDHSHGYIYLYNSEQEHDLIQLFKNEQFYDHHSRSLVSTKNIDLSTYFIFFYYSEINVIELNLITKSKFYKILESINILDDIRKTNLWRLIKCDRIMNDILWSTHNWHKILKEQVKDLLISRTELVDIPNLISISMTYFRRPIPTVPAELMKHTVVNKILEGILQHRSYSYRHNVRKFSLSDPMTLRSEESTQARGYNPPASRPTDLFRKSTRDQEFQFYIMNLMHANYCICSRRFYGSE